MSKKDGKTYGVSWDADRNHSKWERPGSKVTKEMDKFLKERGYVVGDKDTQWRKGHLVVNCSVTQVAEESNIDVEVMCGATGVKFFNPDEKTAPTLELDYPEENRMIQDEKLRKKDLEERIVKFWENLDKWTKEN